ncbi:MAG: hypothetical protein WC091_02680 [Sulfuricellaceae bacterium]
MTQQTLTQEGAFSNDQRKQINENFDELYTLVGAGNFAVSAESLEVAEATELNGPVDMAETLDVVGAVTAASFSGIGAVAVARQSADVVVDESATLTALTGLSHTVVAGTYAYRINVQALSTANGGVKVGFALTTAVLTSIQNVGKGTTAAGAGASARTTTATTGATLYGSTAAVTGVVIEGTMVVATGGTFALQGAQNASHADETTFYTGSTFELTRIA